MRAIFAWGVFVAAAGGGLHASPARQNPLAGTRTSFVVPDTSGWSPLQRALLAFEQVRSAAIARHDTATLRTMYADEFRGVAANGLEVDRERLLGVFLLDDPASVFTIDEIAVRSLDRAGTTAVWTARLTTNGRGGEIVAQSRFVHVYVRRDGRWQILVGQGTALPVPP
jgi:ketosteroid isomerase-like protein